MPSRRSVCAPPANKLCRWLHSRVVACVRAAAGAALPARPADASGPRGRSYRPHPRLARALDIMFTLHAEHEMNCSTAAARHLASSGVDVYTAVAGARIRVTYPMRPMCPRDLLATPALYGRALPPLLPLRNY